MAKIFNTTADCKPDLHYMVNIDNKLVEIRKLVDGGAYFTINRARQYGKTTTLRALNRFLKDDYYIVLMDFQTFGAGEFQDENVFSLSFARSFLRVFKRNALPDAGGLSEAVSGLEETLKTESSHFRLLRLFECLSDICAASDRRIVLMIDEVDSASNNQVFLDFLAQLRAYYIDRDVQPTFWSVILSGVYDVRNLKRKFRPDEDHKINSPWNIAADFNVDMSFSEGEIAGMLQEYEDDHDTGMDIPVMAKHLHDYTAGYPFLVSRLCKIMDEVIFGKSGYETKSGVWTLNGINEAVKVLLTEKNMLFESLSEKLEGYPELRQMLYTVLFSGRAVTYNFYDSSINIATMFGFVKDQNGVLAITNRIFETWLYNLFLSTTEMQSKDMYAVSLQDKNQFITGGHLNMKLVLEKFVIHFRNLYGDKDEAFVEEEGRKYFLLYLRPIINGTGNYYIESRTRGLRRTDVIVDYNGEQFIIEMKIWHGAEYHNRGEEQLVGYLDDYNQKTGYMLSFNFNRNKQTGVHEVLIGDKLLIEAVV